MNNIFFIEMVDNSSLGIIFFSLQKYPLVLNLCISEYSPSGGVHKATKIMFFYWI